MSYMKKALIVVDVQNDFCEGGALAVKGGEKVAKSITDFIEKKGDRYDLIVATRDWHDPDGDNGGHFSCEPDFVDSWPHHCVRGTYGAQYSDSFDVDAAGIDIHIVKGMGKPAYSGFEGVLEGGRYDLEAILSDHDIAAIDVVGIATDYCVKATALDGSNYGFKTRVILDLTAPIHGHIEELSEELGHHHVSVAFTDGGMKIWNGKTGEWK